MRPGRPWLRWRVWRSCCSGPVDLRGPNSSALEKGSWSGRWTGIWSTFSPPTGSSTRRSWLGPPKRSAAGSRPIAGGSSPPSNPPMPRWRRRSSLGSTARRCPPAQLAPPSDARRPAGRAERGADTRSHRARRLDPAAQAPGSSTTPSRPVCASRSTTDWRLSTRYPRR